VKSASRAPADKHGPFRRKPNNLQSLRLRIPIHEELTMKIRTKIRAGRACGERLCA
jgi:hypothetical protein